MPPLPSLLPPAGAPQRVSGKVSGTVTVGTTPVVLDNIDLHAYIVVGDGRAYTAISEVSTLALLPPVNHFTVGKIFLVFCISESFLVTFFSLLQDVKLNRKKINLYH